MRNSGVNTVSDEELLKLRGGGFFEELEKKTKELQKEGKRPKLLLHSCCAPCSSACLEYLVKNFDVTAFYYNPNISIKEEYDKRVSEMKRLVNIYDGDVSLAEGRYDIKEFLDAVKGLEKEPEGGLRCVKCFRLRLYETARVAAENGFDFFTTTLTISPLKNAALLNALGREASERFGSEFLPSDFKKRGGYQRSIELSKEYGLYRQDYCGCAFSKAEREAFKKKKAEENIK